MKLRHIIPAGLAALAFVGLAHGAGSHNTGAPVNYGADHIELFDKENRVLLSGNVDVTQDDMRLTAARGVVSYSREGSSVKIHRFDASGAVSVTRGVENARGDVAIYDFDQRIITLVGNVVLHRASDVLRGGRLVMDLDTGIATVDGHGGGGGDGAPGSSHSGGRVTGSFTVPDKNATRQDGAN